MDSITPARIIGSVLRDFDQAGITAKLMPMYMGGEPMTAIILPAVKLAEIKHADGSQAWVVAEVMP